MKYTSIGKFLLIASSLIGILPLFIYLSLPIYVIGFIIVINSKMAKKNKIIWTIIPIAFILMVWFIAWILSLLNIF